MELCEPFMKLRAMVLPTPWKGTSFIGSSNFIEDMIEEHDRNHGFQNEDIELSRIRFVEVLTPYFQLVNTIIAIVKSHAIPSYGLVTEIDILYQRPQEASWPLEDDLDTIQ